VGDEFLIHNHNQDFYGGHVKTQNGAVAGVISFGSMLLIIFLTSCTKTSGSCPMQPYADLSNAESYAGDDRLPFQFPLEDVFSLSSLSHTEFCTNNGAIDAKRTYHAAEDYFRPAGTPVYAIADGEISFSGPMGGYGWLIIVDHPQANIYSLYGHLSPSRWYKKTGSVSKGEMIAHLGDSNENGGSDENPLEPHLHLGIRSGQREDYPARGDWRWQAGWIKSCPPEIGWLRPSEIITQQIIPNSGFREPPANFLAKWGVELLFSTIYLFGGICMIIYTTRRNQPVVIVISSVVFLVAGWIFYKDGWKMSYFLIGMGSIFLIIGGYRVIRNYWDRSKVRDMA